MTALDRLNASADEAARELRRCCGASAWVDAMVAARPFKDPAHVRTLADQAWAKMTPADWREAFSHHPKIGDVNDLRERFAATAGWAEKEQQGVAAATEATLRALADGNRAYEARFGFLFIVCATGKRADELLALLRERMNHTVEDELRLAAHEQSKITHLRLEKLLSS